MSKTITQLPLISAVTDDVNLPADDTLQTYRTTAAQIKSYILAAGNILTAMIADAQVTKAKLASDAAQSLVPIGAIMPYAAATAPSGFLLCNGDAVSRTTYASLFALLGVTHGQGDGSTTFNLPDYRGRFLRGVDGGIARDPNRATRTAMATGGNTGDNVGSVQTDAFQNITGSLGPMLGISGVSTKTGSLSGSVNTGTNNWIGTSSSFNSVSVNFDASTSSGARTSTETRPTNAYVQYIIKT